MELRGIKLNTSEARFPTSYAIQEISITNFAGRTWDIQKIVTDFSITESLYTASLLLTLNIKDPVNFMHEARLTGHEKIQIKLARRAFGGENNVKNEDVVNHTFYVTEYPVYAKSGTIQQVYSIRAISQHAYLSQFKRISRSFSGNIRDFVQTVFEKDLFADGDMVSVSNSIAGNVSVVVPNLHPLDAVYWMLRRAFDETGSPAHLYQTLDSVIRCQTQTNLIEQTVYREYSHAKYFKTNPSVDPTGDYEERASRILAIASDLKLSKFISGASGAYGSRSEYLDLATKSITRKNFDYLNDFSQMKFLLKYPALAAEFKPEESDSLSKYKDARVNYIPLNSLAFIDSAPNYNHSTAAGMINRAQAYAENLDTIQHDLTVAGDFKLNAGKVISMKLPPAVDPNSKKENANSDPNLQADEFLSGNYVVTSVVHRFDSMYFCDLRVKRDAFSAKYFSSSVS